MNVKGMTDFEVVSQLRMYESRPHGNGMNFNDQQRSLWRNEANRRGIDTYSTTSSGLGYPLNIGHIRYKDGSVLNNAKGRG
ncbi:MAG: hypothetical protein U1E65_02160 [Myxococcota bacterium]